MTNANELSKIELNCKIIIFTSFQNHKLSKFDLNYTTNVFYLISKRPMQTNCQKVYFNCKIIIFYLISERQIVKKLV